jgi:uncharacterized iron-regulated protein
MKKKILSFLAIAALAFSFTSCGSDDEPKKDTTTQEPESYTLDYSSSNASSWQNYMYQVANLLKQDAESLYDSWTVSYNGGQPFATIFKNHNSSDYSSVKSCLQEIVEGCADIANEVGSSKIGDPFNLYISGQTTKALYAVESWYSWHSRDDYTNNIWSIRNSYCGSLDGSIAQNSISKVISETNPTLDQEILNAINTAANSIQAIPQPFRNNINSSEASTAMTACSDLELVLKNKLKPAIEGLKDQDTRLQAVVENWIDVVVLPTYQSLKDKNTALLAAIQAFNRNPSDNNFASACEAWLTAREPWEKSEAFLFGPVDALGLDPNMDSWPLDQDAIVQILVSGKYNDLNWSDGDDDDAIEAVQSVRGFHTLEFLLFKNGNPRKINN